MQQATLSTATNQKIAMTDTIVIIDSGIENYQALLDGVVEGAVVFVLDAHRDGIQQITAFLRNSTFTVQNRPTLHILAHGAPGKLSLGNSELSLSTLNRYADALTTWTVDQLLLYGCNVAAGDAGEEFIAKLHHLVGTPIAASTTQIGNVALGANWVLDVTTHQQKVELPINSATTAAYSHVLAILPDVSTIFSINGDASRLSANEIRLVPALQRQSGSAYSSARIDFTLDWDFTFDLNFGTDNLGADGIGFVLHNDPDGATVTGDLGQGLGILGVRNSVGIEFDTFRNIDVGDPIADHTSIFDPELGLQAFFTGITEFTSNIEDGADHRVVVSWDQSSTTLSYTFDGVFIDSIQKDLINDDFAGSDLIYWGFGSSTGSAFNAHVVKVIDFNGRLVDQDGNDIPLDPSPGPTAIITPLADPIRDFGVTSLEIVFSEAVQNFDLSDILLTLDGQSIDLTGASLTSSNNITWTLSSIPGGATASGNYAIDLDVDNGGITDSESNGLESATGTTWLTGYTADPRPLPDVSGAYQREPGQGTNESETLKGTTFSDGINGDNGDDLILGFKGNDRLYGGNGNDTIEGRADNDLILGNWGSDILHGDSGDDIIDGGAGIDILSGGLGDDVLDGRFGKDLMSGDEGFDIFVLSKLVEEGDRVRDFDVNQDLLDVREIFADTAFSGPNRFARFLRYIELEQSDNGKHTLVNIDADGKGSGDRMITLVTLNDTDATMVGSQHFIVGDAM